MDKKIAHNILVGIVALIGFGGFVFVLFNIGGGGVLTSRYTLYGKFNDVKGLHMGSEISLSGLRIGVVKAIQVSPDAKRELVVVMAIQKHVQSKIRSDSIAAIKTQGVLGDKYIEISIGSEEATPLASGDSIQTLEPTDLMTKGGNLVDGISKQFGKGGDFDTVMHNLSIVSKNLAVMTTQMQNEKGMLREMISGTSGQKLNRAVGHLENVLKKIDSGQGSLGALVNDPTVYEDIKSITGGAKRSTILQYFVRQMSESNRPK